MTRDDVRNLIHERAEQPEMSSGYWLNDRNGDLGYYEGDFCEKCVRAIPVLPGLVMCHLVSMLGENLGPDHEWGPPKDNGYQDCMHCNEWIQKEWRDRGGVVVPGKSATRPCLTIPARIMSRLGEVVDGGWAIEHDSMATCDACGIDLHVCPTDYCVEQELNHWQKFGPPTDGYQWWQLGEVLDSCNEAAWARLLAMVAKWGLS